MSYNIQQSDISILSQSNRTVYLRAELLSNNFKLLKYIDGEIISDDYSVDADSDIRRTYNARFIVLNNSVLSDFTNSVWLDKYVRIFTGLLSQRTGEIQWYPMGIYMLRDISYSYDANSRELTLSCVDMMAKLTGDRNGRVSGLSKKILAGAPIHNAVIDTISQLGNITKYRIDNGGKVVPYDLEFGADISVYDILKELRDLYPGWEAFFDDDCFIYQQYPTRISDPIVLDAETISPLIISERTDLAFNEIKNVIEVWGKCLSTDYYTDNVTYNLNTYNATFAGVSNLTNGLMLGFKACSDNIDGASFKVNGFTSYKITSGSGDITSGMIKNGLSYVLKFVSNGSESYFSFCGQYQICAIAKLMSAMPSEEKQIFDKENEPTTNISYVINPESPFCCDIDGVGEIRQVCEGDNFENIYSDDLASQRAKYELWKSTDLLDNITLQMIEIPWLDVNQKIEYTSNITGETNVYIVKQKQGSSTEGVMTLSCTKFQPIYSWASF